MGATPKTGSIHFKGLRTGATYSKPIYNADANGTLCRIGISGATPGAAGGQDYCVFDEPVQLYDAAFVTGIVDTANLLVLANFNPTKFSINWATYVNTLANRPPLNIQFNAGTRISLQQVP